MGELHFYDFDGTLFRSPFQPLWWPGGAAWWADQRSLNEPCVPDKPGADWWIGDTVTQAKRSISDPDVYAVLATGRSDRAYRWRVPELLKQKGLRFDEVHLNPGVGGTQAWKAGLLVKLLRRYPAIRKIQIWEDRPGHLSAFESMLRKAGYEVEAHLVRAEAKEPLCSLDDPELTEPGDPVKAVYTEIALVDPDQLKDWVVHELGEMLLEKPYMHHVTLGYEPSEDEVRALPIGKRVKVKVVGWAADDQAQVVVVQLPGLSVESGRVPHITVSTSGAAPVYSNELLARGYTKVNGPSLDGVIGFFDGHEHRFRTAGSPSRKKCMTKGCDKPPLHDCIWADGRGRAWFCGKHWSDWNNPSREVVYHHKIDDGEVPEKFSDYRPKRAERIARRLVAIDRVTNRS